MTLVADAIFRPVFPTFTALRRSTAMDGRSTRLLDIHTARRCGVSFLRYHSATWF